VRATKDVDILLGGDRDNLARAANAADAFGAPKNVVAALRTLGEDEIAFFGQPPMRVDFLRTIDGVATDEVLSRAVRATIDGIDLRFIALDDLLRNKRAAGRARDLEDVAFLERVRSRKTPKR
jgi:hypothetical protein